MKPLLFVTGHAPAYRVGAFARLHELEQIEVALFGGASKHGGADFAGKLPFPHRHVRPRELFALAASGRYRAVVCPTGGRFAPLATWAGARRAGIPVVVWASLWAHPRSAAHTLTYLPLRHLYRSADAVVTYGPHVSAYVRARGARNVHVAPQAVDNDFWRSPVLSHPTDPRWPAHAEVHFLFVGRAAKEKGLPVLLAAWHAAGMSAATAALVITGIEPEAVTLGQQSQAGAPSASSAPVTGVSPSASSAPVVCLGKLEPGQLRDVYGACDVLVVPSIPTRTFREPWGLVVNEAMNQALAIIATDAVGAAAGGLVRDGDNGLIVPAGDSHALARALAQLAADPALRNKLGSAGANDVLAFSHNAWAHGFSQALSSLDISARIGSVG